MPGAPNRPPEMNVEPAPPVALVPPARKALRRLAPARVALQLALWKGAVPTDVYAPFDRAEKAFAASDFVNTESALDALAVRLAEPRWPTLPLPFRDLRVVIVQPQPPSWDPDAALSPADRDAKKARRHAESQLALAKASLDWAQAKGTDVADLKGPLDTAGVAFTTDGASEEFWVQIDAIWTALRARLPPPKSAPSRNPPPPAAEAPDPELG
jgi:hypothetical protein